MSATVNDHRKVPFIIGVAGGTASGKSSVCARIMEQLGALRKRVITIAQDSFYRDLLTDEEIEKAQRGEFNFDHPDAFDHDLMLGVLNNLKDGKSDKIPVYDFRSHSRVKDQFETVDGADVILVEGILIFYDPELRNMFNMKIFVDADPDIRLARRVARDTKERGRPLTHVLHQYLNLVKPAFEEFCLPTKKYADIIIPRGADNDVAIGLIVQHIQELLRSPRSSPENGDRIVEKENHLSLPNSGSSTPRQRIPSGDVHIMSRPH
uniref:Uridine kinase n=1 Tax=Acrobeloides nanus TaxID=290746 RepID=A0A914CM70_9BILA